MKLVNWIAKFNPRQLVKLDPVLKLPFFLTDEDLNNIISSGNSIFWETNPPDISLFDYAYVDIHSGLTYSNTGTKPGFISFHCSGLPEDRLEELRRKYPKHVVVDYLYVSMRID